MTAWESFQSGDSEALARPEIQESWSRSRALGVDPEGIDMHPHEYDDDANFITVGSQVINSTADLLVGDTASVALFDEAGVLVWRWETQSGLRRELERLSIIQGHQFVETGVGTCGVGLSMAVHQPTIVAGSEHYKQAWHRFTCATAPVIDPVTHRSLGNLNVCCLAEDTNRFVIAAVMAFTERVRSALRDVATPRQRRLMDAHLRYRGEGSAVVTLDNEIMISDDGLTDHLPDRGTLWTALAESGPSTTEIALPNGRVARVRPVTPSRFEDGCVLIFESWERVLHDEDPLGRAEADVIRRTLHDCAGNKSLAAQQLGISRGTLYQRMRRYKIN